MTILQSINCTPRCTFYDRIRNYTMNVYVTIMMSKSKRDDEGAKKQISEWCRKTFIKFITGNWNNDEPERSRGQNVCCETLKRKLHNSQRGRIMTDQLKS